MNDTEPLQTPASVDPQSTPTVPDVATDTEVATDSSPSVGSTSSQEEQRLEDVADIDEARLYAMLSYISVLVLVPWLTRKDDPFVNYHVRQGIVICISTILTLVLTAWAPRIGSALFLLLLITSVVGIVMALSGRQWKIPVVGHLASLFKL